MKKKKKKSNLLAQRSELTRTLLNILLLAVVAGLLVLSIVLVRIKLLQNTHQLGMALAQSYAVEETLTRDTLQDTALIAGQYIDEISSGGGTPEQIQHWMQSYFNKLTAIIGTALVDPYVVINGQLIGATPWEGDADYDYGATQWYQLALQEHGMPVFSDVYTDAVTGQLVITLSMELAQPGDVLAMDIYIQNNELHNTLQTLPEGYSYYLCDDNGALLYAVSSWSTDGQSLQNVASYLVRCIQDGSLESYDAFFRDPSNALRGGLLRGDGQRLDGHCDHSHPVGAHGGREHCPLCHGRGGAAALYAAGGADRAGRHALAADQAGRRHRPYAGRFLLCHLPDKFPPGQLRGHQVRPRSGGAAPPAGGLSRAAAASV